MNCKKKNRRDLYYFLSKKYFFRSRAAFKLIELNQKFGFLNQAEGIVDLCAAPGGWLQVVQKTVDSSSLIVGIDAKKIAPIKGCNMISADITSPGCIQPILKLKIWKKKRINVVLHDGAPRMGTSWARDAINQNDLAFNAFKVVICCIEKKGWFVSKIFCSGNFHGLLFLFNIFFEKIKICKPKASRRSSAETYIICKNFIKPNKFDQNLLNSKFIFGNSYLKPKKRSFEEVFNDNSKKKKNFLKFLRIKTRSKNITECTAKITEELLSMWGKSFYGKYHIFMKSRKKHKKQFLDFGFYYILYFFKIYLGKTIH